MIESTKMTQILKILFRVCFLERGNSPALFENDSTWVVGFELSQAIVDDEGHGKVFFFPLRLSSILVVLIIGITNLRCLMFGVLGKEHQVQRLSMPADSLWSAIERLPPIISAFSMCFFLFISCSCSSPHLLSYNRIGRRTLDDARESLIEHLALLSPPPPPPPTPRAAVAAAGTEQTQSSASSPELSDDIPGNNTAAPGQGDHGTDKVIVAV